MNMNRSQGFLSRLKSVIQTVVDWIKSRFGLSRPSEFEILADREPAPTGMPFSPTPLMEAPLFPVDEHNRSFALAQDLDEAQIDAGSATKPSPLVESSPE